MPQSRTNSLPKKAISISVDETQIHCDGLSGKHGVTAAALGHPRVYLNLETAGQIVCPYCGIKFVHSASVHAAAPA